MLLLLIAEGAPEIFERNGLVVVSGREPMREEGAELRRPVGILEDIVDAPKGREVGALIAFVRLAKDFLKCVIGGSEALRG